MMKTSRGEEETGDHPGSVTEIKEESKRPCKSAALQDHLSLPGISILDKLIKTCPVWLQLGLSQERAKEILQKEPAGVFLVRRDALDKVMMLSVHIPDQKIPENIKSYRIKEENSLLYLEGSLLVFEDIFKLVAFYCDPGGIHCLRGIPVSPMTTEEVVRSLRL
ncbi:ras and Rab interactor 3-like [Latimeria chalumnae]|uniref:ras and Rab interactor 3-like n=1 Tax=Latimeria chalumnae TaxID=7897 RepID=UPI00313C5108